MIGYDTHGAQTPPDWDELPTLYHDELNSDGFVCHGQCDFAPCNGEIEEYTEKTEGWPLRVFYRCTKCNVDVTNEVINKDRDTVDWEFDYER